MSDKQEQARQTMNAIYALEAADGPKSDYDHMKDEVAKLRDAFLAAVPAAMNDHRFPEMMGSPWSVLQYVTEHFERREPS